MDFGRLKGLTRRVGLSTTTATMQIFRHIGGLPAEARGAAIALGNFDGVHLGHQAVIGAAQSAAERVGAPSAVMTFDPHPRRFFKPDDHLFELTPLPAKTRHLAATGADILYLLHFDAALAAMPAEQFVTDILVAGAGATHVVAGYDFVFGRGRKGDVALLQAMGEKLGFEVTVVPVVSGESTAFSSTVIRHHLRDGEPRRAAAHLGRLWEIEGVVQTGDRRGRQIGFPTANVDPGQYVTPKLGVYAVWAGIVDGDRTDWRDAVVNVGRRPTFQGEGITVEVHLFDFDGDLYGKTLRVAFNEFLRPEMKFDGIDAIKAQIEKDCVEARRMLEACAADQQWLPPYAASAAVT